MWQEISIILIGIITLFLIGNKVYKLFSIKKHPDNQCINCNGCSLKKNAFPSKNTTNINKNTFVNQ